MRILHVVPTFYPATEWGGPIFSTLSLCEWAASLDNTEVNVITTDAASPTSRERLNVESSVNFRPGFDVTYHRRIAGHSISISLLKALPKAIARADLVHLTSAYSFPTLPTLLLAALYRKPVVWSLRGAVQATHEWKGVPNKKFKTFFEKLAMLAAPENTVALGTAEEEVMATKARMPKLRTEVISNSVACPADDVISNRKWQKGGSLRLLYLGRIHEKKGVHLILEAMAGLDELVELDVYGSGADDYLERLSKLANSSGIADRVRFHGHVSGPEKTEAFCTADVLVLPSFSENFGIVVAEAFAHGIPVITSDNTPWAHIEDLGCGLCIPAKTEALIQAVNTIRDEDLAAMGSRGRALVKTNLSTQAVNRKLLEIYTDLIRGNQR